jgi:hemerythrin
MPPKAPEAEAEPEVETVMDMVHEDHLRLAFLFDLIEDQLAAEISVKPVLAELLFEYERHSRREELALAQNFPDQLDGHRAGHLRMRDMLQQIVADYDRGEDIRPALERVEVEFTTQLLPADAVFRELASTPL